MDDHRALKPESEARVERLRMLKETLPECFNEGRLDPDKVRESFGEENLEVLRLLQKAYRGRVKMIYIDPSRIICSS